MAWRFLPGNRGRLVKRRVTKPPFDFPALAALESAPPSPLAIGLPSMVCFEMPVGRARGGAIQAFHADLTRRFPIR